MVDFKENEQLNTLNHSCAHVMAQAIKHLYPHAKFWVGPVVSEGFYYDVDLGDDVVNDEDIAKIADAYNAYADGTLENVKGFCAVVDTEGIAKQDYILTPGRYVGIEEQEDDGEPFEDKMNRLTSELSEMFAKSHELEDEIRKKLGAIGYEI